jgi:tripartite-type tricarboxylate transporter receptor subunit TctC
MDRIGLIRRIGRAAACVGLALATLSPSHHARAADDAFFKGKTVRIIVGYNPGGGYDALARMLAQPLEKRIGATVIIENKPGAGGLGALKGLMHDRPDGLRMMLLNGEGAALAQIIDLPGMQFDLPALGILGRVSYENRILLASEKTPFSQIGAFERATKPVIFGSGNRTDGMGDMAEIFCRAMRIPCKLVTGYPGSKDVTLALMRGEVDAQVTSESQSAQLLRSGGVVAVAVLAPHKAPMLPKTPTIFDLTKLSPAQAKWIRFRAGISDIGRIMVLPPKVPADRATVLEAAFRAVLTDPAVIAEGKRTNRPVDYAPAAETRKVLADVVGGLKPDERKEIKDLILHGY